MARQPEHQEGLTIDLSGLPGGRLIPGEEPEVGNIYKPRSGQRGFWWIVSITRGEFHHTALYLIFNLNGECVGTSKAAMYYLRDREKIGHMALPDLTPEWF
jgi:hypothetical protein